MVASAPHLLVGVPLSQPPPEVLLFSNASAEGWGIHCQDLQASSLWSVDQRRLHANLLELRAVWLGLDALIHYLSDNRVVAMTNNALAVGYVTHQGGTRSRSLCQLTLDLLRWTQERGISLYFSPVPDPQALGTDAMEQEWSRMVAYAYPPLQLLRPVLNKIGAPQELEVLLVAPLWPHREWYPDLLELLVDLPRALSPWPSHLKQPHLDRFHDSVGSIDLHVWRVSGEPFMVHLEVPICTRI